MPPTGLITVTIDEQELERLRRASGCTGSGGAQKLIHRLREGLKGKRLTVRESDIPKIVKLWNTPRRGGFQRILPIKSLREYLPSVAPLFSEAVEIKQATRWIYFRHPFNDRGRVKIGGTYRDRRRDQERFTDNPTRLITLLKIEELPDRTEIDLHRRFAKWRIRKDQEWFWFDDAIWEFINAESAKQELSKRGQGNDAASSSRPTSRKGAA